MDLGSWSTYLADGLYVPCCVDESLSLLVHSAVSEDFPCYCPQDFFSAFCFFNFKENKPNPTSPHGLTAL